MIDPIAKLHSPEGTLLSVYVNRRAPATRAALVDLLKPLRQATPADEDHDHHKGIRADVQRVVEMAGRIDAGSAPAVAIFASAPDGILEFQPLTQPVDVDVAMVGPRPYLRPLRAQSRPVRAGVLVADSNRARTYVASGGALTEIGDALTADTGKENYAGFRGLDEHHNRARADHQSAKLWRDAGRRLLEAHQDQPLELLLIGSHEEAFEPIAAEQHPYLQALARRRITAEPGSGTRADLAGVVSAAIAAHARQAEQELVDRLLGELDGGGQAVSGLAAVLEACAAHAVDHLVVAGPYAKEGVVCDSCGWLGRTGKQCPVCGSHLFETADVVAAAMDATVDAGGKATVVTVASRLDAAGIAAITRFDLGARPG